VTHSYTLRGAQVWDGLTEARSGTPLAVHVRGDRIAQIGADSEIAPGSTEIDLAGTTLIPGLIDSHVHMGLDPHINSPDEQLAVPIPDQLKGMEARASAMVRAGITTARDLGGGCWRELVLRDRIERGELPGPRLLCAGQPLTTPGGHCHFWGGEANGEDEIRAVLERQVEHRVDWIKVMATGGVFTRGTSPRAAQFSASELAQIVERAAASGLCVAAHCHGTDGIHNAALAGVRTIEHCSFAGDHGFGTALDAAVVDEIARAGTWVSPTVNAGWGRRLEHDGRPSRFLLRMSRVLGALERAGVGLIASTDAGIPGVEHHRLPEALLAFSRYAELTPTRTLRAATSEAARALGIASETGSLQPGLSADLLAVDGNPLEDLTCLQKPRMVMARGRVVS